MPDELHDLTDEETIDLKKWGRILHAGRWHIVAMICLTTLIAAVYSFKHPPVYRAEARLLIEKDTPNIVDIAEVVDADMADREYYQAQAEIIKSRPIALRVLEEFNLTADQMHELSFSLPRAVYTAIQQQLALWLKGYAADDSTEGEGVDVERERAINLLLDQITVTPIKGSRLLRISVDTTDAKQSAALANSVVRAYIHQQLSAKIAASQEAVTWLDREVEEARQNVEASEKALQQYKEIHEILSIQDRQNIVMQKLSDLNTAVSEAKVKRMQLEARYNRVRNTPPEALETIPEVLKDPLVQRLRIELVEVESELLELQKKYRAKHPAVTAVEAQVQGLQEQIAASVNRIITGMRNEYELALDQERELLGALEQQKADVQALNQKTIEYTVLEREVESNRNLYDGLLQRMKEASLTERLETSNIQIVEEAVAPLRPIAPQKGRTIAIGMGLGLFLGVGLVGFLELRDSSIRSPDDVKHALNLTVLGTIPYVKAKEVAGTDLASDDKQTVAAAMISMITLIEPQSHVAEAYRGLRTNVTFAALGRPAVMLVTSTSPGEGKSSVTANLGMTLAQSQRKTLLIDCDFRRPMLSRIFHLHEQTRGFSDALLHADTEREIVTVIHHTDVDWLDIIPCGTIPPNPSEMLSLERTGLTFSALRDTYAHILIDSPPVTAVTDPVILSQLVDGVLFVIKAGVTNIDAARYARDELLRVQAKLWGAILNQVDFRKHGAYYYGYKENRYYQQSTRY